LGPDAPSLTAPGLWGNIPYEYAPLSFYERNPRFFGPVDSFFGALVPREVLSFESTAPRQTESAVFLDAGLPFTRDYNPDLATFKLGPLYGDILRIGAEAVWSDFSGDNFGDSGDDDGWLSIITLDARALLQISENLFISISGRVFYLPGDNEAGFYFGDGGNFSYLRLEYETYIKDWTFRAYDHFRVSHPLSEILDEVEVNEIETAGRYRFGRIDTDTASSIFEDDDLYFVNTAGLQASTHLNKDWLFDTGFEHIDVWRTFDFDRITSYDRLTALLQYTGEDLNFTPYFYYSLTALDDFQNWRHTAWAGLRGRLTQNLRLDSRVGYLNQDNADSVDTESFLWQIGLIHELGPYTNHSLYGGTTVQDTEFGNEYLASFVRYSIRQQLGSRIHSSVFAQWFDFEDLEQNFPERSGWLTGASLNISLSDTTWISLRASYDIFDERGDGGVRPDRDRWLYRASISHRLFPQLIGRLSYQYEDFGREGAGGFTEHMIRIGLFRYF